MAATVAVLLYGAVCGAAVVLLAAGSPDDGYGAMWALLWGAGLLGAFLAGFAARGRMPRSADARQAAGCEEGGGDPMDAAEAVAKAELKGAGETGVRLGKVNTVAPGRPTAVRAALALGVCLALVGGGLWALWPDDEAGRHVKADAPATSARPAKPTVAWQVPATGGRYDQGPGAWGLGDMVVQGRIDGLFAYGARDGALRWSLPAPTREAVCAMSSGVEQGVGLIAYGRHDKPCAVLVAVRTSDGKALWQKPLAGDGLVEGAVAVAGSTAVTAEDGALRARSLETGEQRWQRALAKNCQGRAVDATAVRTLLVEQCGAGARLVALDTGTGKERWVRPLPVESKVVAAVVSVAPVVLAVSEEDQRGTRALLAFDERGTPTATVPVPGLVLPKGMPSDATTEGRPLVIGDLLVTAAASDSVPDMVVAHSLTDGRKVWEYTADDLPMYGIARESGGRIGVLAEDENGAFVILLDAKGAERGRIKPHGDKGSALSIRPELIPVTGGHVVVNHMSMSGEPAVFSLP